MYNIDEFVKLVKNNMVGYITRRYTKNNENYYLVKLDTNVILNVSEKDIILTDEKSNNQNMYLKNIQNRSKISFEHDKNLSPSLIPEIMLRHQTYDEAFINLDNFVNDAILNDVKKIRIIHGKSGGVLRDMVAKYLKSNKNVKSFHLGNYFEGSYGVTIAILK